MLESLLGSGDEIKEHPQQSRMQKIFSFNFNCIIAAFSILCILINCYQMTVSDQNKKVKTIGEYVNSSELNAMTQEDVN